MNYKEKLIQLLNSEELTKEEKERLCEIFPELVESKDERVKKALIGFFKKRMQEYADRNGNIEGCSFPSVIAWLEKLSKQPKEHDICDYCDQNGGCIDPCPTKLIEKQGEQKTAKWSEEGEDIIEWLIGYLEYQIMNAAITEEKNNCLDAVSMLKSLRSQSHWKPSDEQMNTLEYYMHTLICNEHKEILFGLYADLKKLREENL